MDIALFIAGLVGGLTFLGIIYFLLHFFGFHEVEENAISWSIGIFTIIGAFILFITFIFVLMEDAINRNLIIGIIAGIILSGLYLTYKLTCASGRHVLLLKKISKIEENISDIDGYSLSDKQITAINILRKTQKKLEEQANDILIADSIKIAKDIELSNKKINIQREIDELEALQILNR